MKKYVKQRWMGKFSLFVTGLLLCMSAGAIAAQNLNAEFPAEALSVRLNKIARTAGVTVTFVEEELRDIRVAAFSARNVSVAQALSHTLSPTSFIWKETSASAYAVVPDPQKQATAGYLAGTVIDKSGFPIPGATIQITGTTLGIATDVKGKFSLELPADRIYSVEIRCISYQPMRISDVKINEGKTTSLDVVLQEATEDLDEVVVSAHYKQASVQALYAKQKERVAMTDGISSDLIKKTSDNNVAQVLRRLPGVSLNDGKFITIRGVSERYNNVSINGSLMPSTEPNRKNFAFDLLPTNLVDQVIVAKTFTPDMSAEFAGGTVEVTTLNIPEKAFLSLSMGMGINTNTTGKPFVSGKRFGADYFLGKSQTRDWMGRDWNMDWYTDLMGGSVARPPFNNWGAMNKMNAKIPNLWGMYNYTGKPMQNYSFNAGLPFNIGEHKFGVITGASYRHEEQRESYGSNEEQNATKVQYDVSPFTYIFPSNKYTFTTSFSALANLGWEWHGQRISWKNLFTSRFVHTNMMKQFETDEGYGKSIQTLSSPRRSQIIQTRLEGEHEVWGKRFHLSWYADYNKLDREQPDERNVRGSVQNASAGNRNPLVNWGGYIGTEPGAYDHIFSSDLNEYKKNIGAAITVPFTVTDNTQKVKVGWDGNFRDADYIQYWLNINPTNRQQAINTQDLDQYITPDMFLDSILYYVPWGESLKGADGYNGSLDIKSFYAMGEFAFLKNRLHLTGGMRLEKANFKTTGLFRNYEKSKMIDTVRSYEKSDWFPSVNVTGNVTDNLMLRASYTKTIARFDFREMSNNDYFDLLENMELSGNDTLKNTYIQNVDIRAEWYPSAGEIVSLSFFYKKFKDPIEMYVYQNASTLYGKPINAQQAIGKGFEVNFRKSLGFIAPGSFLKDVYLSANGMYMDMQVKYRTSQMNADSIRKRPLQDLVPYSINAGLSWQGKILGASANWGTTGRKLLRSTPTAAEDQYEAGGRQVLDLQLSARFLKGRIEAKANVSDILNQPIIQYRNCGFKDNLGAYPGRWWNGVQDKGTPYTDDMDYNKGKDWMIKKTYKGSSYSFSVSYKF